MALFSRGVRVENSVPAFALAGIKNFDGSGRECILWGLSGAVTADDLNNIVYVCHKDGTRVIDVILSLGNTGTDPTNPLQAAVDVLKNGSYSVLSAQPAITKAAADGTNTATAGAGVTQAAVVTSGYRDLVVGDRLELDFGITRNAGTVSDEIADPLVQIILAVPLGL